MPTDTICNGLISRLRDNLDQMVFQHDMKKEGRQKDTSTIFHKRGLQLNLGQAVASSPVAFWHGSQDSLELPSEDARHGNRGTRAEKAAKVR